MARKWGDIVVNSLADVACRLYGSTSDYYETLLIFCFSFYLFFSIFIFLFFLFFFLKKGQHRFSIIFKDNRARFVTLKSIMYTNGIVSFQLIKIQVEKIRGYVRIRLLCIIYT